VLEDGSVRVFSRNQEDNTNKYPDIVRRMQTLLAGLEQQQSVMSAVIDSEAVAWDRQQNCILPFQELSRRKRKVPLIILCFIITSGQSYLVKAALSLGRIGTPHVIKCSLGRQD